MHPMQRLCVIVLVLSLGAWIASGEPGQTTQQTREPLSNEDVIDLLQAGLSPEVVIAKIKSTPCKFETSPAALRQLKAAHVPSSVILVMVQSPPPQEESIRTGWVRCAPGASEVSVWLAPGKLDEVDSPRCGEKLNILEEKDLWAKVRTKDGKVGYISELAVSEGRAGTEMNSTNRGSSSLPPPGPANPPAPRAKPSPPLASMVATGSACSPAVESTIAGEFEGWSGESIFKLDNGQIWEQAEYDYTYDYEYRPDVIIYQAIDGCKMKVEGLDETILVRRIK
jgi:hypothetical protein